jgi:hypothetical protein
MGDQIGRMSELVAKPIAVAEFGGFARDLNPPCETDMS